MGEGRVCVGARIRMTKGYRGVEGVISEKTDSKFEFYVVALDNAIHLVAGPSAFEIIEAKEGNPRGQHVKD